MNDISIANGELLLQAGGQVFEEQAAIRSGAVSSRRLVDYRMETDWINLTDFQGFNRLRRINVLFEITGTADCRICYDIMYNYNADRILDTGHFQLPQFTYGDDPRRIHRIIPSVQKCASFKIVFRATTSVSFNISGLTLEYVSIGANMYKKGSYS